MQNFPTKALEKKPMPLTMHIAHEFINRRLSEKLLAKKIYYLMIST